MSNQFLYTHHMDSLNTAEAQFVTTQKNISGSIDFVKHIRKTFNIYLNILLDYCHCQHSNLTNRFFYPSNTRQIQSRETIKREIRNRILENVCLPACKPTSCACAGDTVNLHTHTDTRTYIVPFGGIVNS